MSVNAVDWALRFAPVDARHNGAARVLMCLANVADDEGRNAHPTHRKLAAWCKCSVSTVKRHLSWLEANGLIRRGDQRQAGHFSEWHRPVVWDSVLGNRLELDPDFFDSNDIDSTRGGRPSTENRARGNPGSHVDRGYVDGDTGKPQLTGEPRFTAVTPPPAHLVSYSTSLVRNNPSAPTGISPQAERPPRTMTESARTVHGPTPPEPNPEQRILPGPVPTRRRCAARWRTGCAPCRRCRCPNRWPGPAERELDAARRLIARHGMPLVLAVAEWVSLPPSKTDKGDASGKPYDGFLASHAHRPPLPRTALGPGMPPDGRRPPRASPARRTRHPRRQGRNLAQPPSAESREKVPNYGIPDNLDRRVNKLLDPYDVDAGNDGFEAPRTLRRLLSASPRTMPKANAGPCWRHCGRAAPSWTRNPGRRTTASGSGSRPGPGRRPSVSASSAAVGRGGAGMFPGR